MRTTSSVEAINSVIQRTFPPKPSIFHFAEFLQFHESCKSTDLYQLIQNDISSEKLQRRRYEDREREKHISCISNMLRCDEITVADFLEEISNALPASGLYL